MEKIPRGVYTKELREQAVKLVMEGGEPVKTVAELPSVFSSPSGECHAARFS